MQCRIRDEHRDRSNVQISSETVITVMLFNGQFDILVHITIKYNLYIVSINESDVLYMVPTKRSLIPKYFVVEFLF